MQYEFWNIIPNDETFEIINQLPSVRQRHYFSSLAKECREYNQKYDTFYTFEEYLKMYPDDSSPAKE